MVAAKAFLPFMKDQFKNLEVYHPKSFDGNTVSIASGRCASARGRASD